jgi:hypothetical protein
LVGRPAPGDDPERNECKITPIAGPAEPDHRQTKAGTLIVNRKSGKAARAAKPQERQSRKSSKAARAAKPQGSSHTAMA